MRVVSVGCRRLALSLCHKFAFQCLPLLKFPLRTAQTAPLLLPSTLISPPWKILAGREARTILFTGVALLTICAVICGADGFTSIASFGEAKKDWLGQFLELENGIPSHDTIGRFFRLLDPEAFEQCFLEWMQAACEQIEEEVVAIDGKTLCGSYDSHSNKAALHMVSAWAW